MIWRRRSTEPRNENKTRNMLVPAPVPSASALDALEAAQPNSMPDLDPRGYTAEAERFAKAFTTRTHTLELNFTFESVERLDRFISRQAGKASDGFLIGLGCYIGEVIRRACEGTWSADGTLILSKGVSETFPLQVVEARCRGSASSQENGTLHDYVRTVMRTSRPS